MDPLQKARADALAAAQAIIDGAKADGDRDLTEDETTEVEAKHAEVEQIDKQLKGRKLVNSIRDMTKVAEDDDDNDAGSGAKASSPGEFVVKEIGEDRIKGLRGTRGSIGTKAEFKAATDTQSVPTTLSPAYTDVDTNIVTGLRRRLTVADLLGVESISGSAITYFVEGALEGDFTTVAELGQKPQLHYANPTAVTESLKKIAAFIKESDEILEDLPWYVSAINNRLLYNLALFEENQLLSGDGAGTNLRGLLNRSGIQTETSASAADNADALFRAMTKVQVNSGLEADGIVLNPTDYQALRLSKDANGQYFGGGFFAGPYGNGNIDMQPPVWGAKTVVTPAIAAGTALVLAGKQSSSVIRKGGVRVETTNSNEDDFEFNRVSIRAEERIALAVRYPAAICSVDLA